MSKLMMPQEPIEVTARMLQTFMVRCNGVDYVLFGSVISPPGSEDELDLEMFEFGGLVDVREIIAVLQKDPKTTDAYGESIQ